jgi:hypothetical protein
MVLVASSAYGPEGKEGDRVMTDELLRSVAYLSQAINSSYGLVYEQQR